ncbi:hypothetical protein [Shewanella glacialipiscicola]|uniref:Uncharacterized protein n=1 Tax=Shewanella glacialipiscicola TaxID=614069 RepID=A0ABQ6J7T8_9GAMM|nr:hypothetical protein [Shewanella glacialipiscicola]GMA83012.1 hypothetical protein GCM10025855_25450 [Shewanella glacialipiscicola]
MGLDQNSELIAEVTDGANLVDGKQTWELVDEKKHDIDAMKRCCDAELKTMEKAGMVPAPYYFERVAILSRKEKITNKRYFTVRSTLKKLRRFI